MSEELKACPCPFCGSANITIEWEPCPPMDASDTNRRWFAECCNCSAQGPFCQKEPTVIRAWNTRHQTPLERVIAAGEDSLESHKALITEELTSLHAENAELRQTCERLENNVAAKQMELDGADQVIANLKTPNQGQSLVAAIEGDFAGMAHGDLVLTCGMLTRGRAVWRKEAEEAQKELTTIKASLAELADNLEDAIKPIVGESNYMEGKREAYVNAAAYVRASISKWPHATVTGIEQMSDKTQKALAEMFKAVVVQETAKGSQVVCAKCNKPPARNNTYRALGSGGDYED